MANFHGSHDLRLDDKCRLSIPSAYRQELETSGDSRLVLAKSLPRDGECLHAFTQKKWEERIKLITAQKRIPEIRYLVQFQVASAQQVAPDSAGRIVIPPSLREHAGLSASSEVTLTWGWDEQFDIWARDRWAGVAEASRSGVVAADEVLTDLGL